MDENEYACGNFKNTVYGPEEYLSKQAKKFRRMNLEEYNNYMDKVEESDGFDVDGCSGVINGGITPQAPGSDRWDYAEHAAKFAALEQAEYGGKSIEFVSLVKANTQPGTTYYLTFTATEAMEHTEKTYKAKVWACPGDGELHLMFFEDVSSNTKRDFPEKPTGKRTRGRGNKAITKVEELQSKSGNVSRFLYSKRPTYAYTYGEHGVSYAQDCGQFKSEAFRIYVKELMKRNSNWTYAKVRVLFM